MRPGSRGNLCVLYGSVLSPDLSASGAYTTCFPIGVFCFFFLFFLLARCIVTGSLPLLLWLVLRHPLFKEIFQCKCSTEYLAFVFRDSGCALSLVCGSFCCCCFSLVVGLCTGSVNSR